VTDVLPKLLCEYSLKVAQHFSFVDTTSKNMKFDYALLPSTSKTKPIN
jgi:hypothetical protein